MLKKLLLILSICLSAALMLQLTSCGKPDTTSSTLPAPPPSGGDDNGNGNNNGNGNDDSNSLVGSWQVDNMTYNGQEMTPPDMVLVMNANGTGDVLIDRTSVV